MFIQKLYYHLLCFVKVTVYRSIYHGSFICPSDSTFRKGFHAVIEGKGKIVIGHNVFFNNYCTLASMAGITIGDGTLFGENVKVYDHNHRYRDLSLPIKEQGYSSAPISIGRHCWIASNVVILKGVTIGDNCVIGAGCIVYDDVPSGKVMINRQDLLFR